MNLKQPGFTYSACGQFTKSKERIQKFKETGVSRYIYRNELDKALFQHHLAYADIKEGWLVWCKNFLVKRQLELAEELHKPIITKFKKEKCIQHSKTIFWVLI